MTTTLTRRSALGFLVALGASPAGLARAASGSEELMTECRFTAERMLADPSFALMKRYVENSVGVMIFPEVIKGGFIIGGEGGSGVLLARGSDRSWSMPAFYTLAAGSIGLQIGGQISEVILTLMNEGAVNAVLQDEFKLGADASVAVGPLGHGVEASTTSNLDADIYAFADTAGLFGGVNVEGAAILERASYNREFYGNGAYPRGIVIERRFFNALAEPLRRALP